VKIGPGSTLDEVVEIVSSTLEKAGITAALVGGACAAIYSGGTYTSEDLDLIIQSAPGQRALDEAMASIGFTRRDAQYFHARSDFFVEFPKGPLAIGQDLRIKPVRLKVGRSRVLVLSATDSCRDRLAAFFHWNDRESLDVAIAIAMRRRVNLAVIRAWSVAENSVEKYEVFKRELALARRATLARTRRSARATRSSRGGRP
jgi:hypothetical protein